jgi:hypothetical protein
MNLKSGVGFLIVVVQLCAVCGVCAQILNPGFEYATVVGDMNEPNDWNSQNFVSVMREFTPTPTNGHFNYWLTQPPLFPHEGDSFVVLSTSVDNIKVAEMSQEIIFAAGEKLTGWYFFGTCDYMEWNDWATISLIAEPNQSIRDILLVSVDVAEVGDYSSTDGWQYFEHVFSETDEGLYELKFFISDYSDAVFESYLAVDDLGICIGEEYGDIYEDCQVDFLDVSILAKYWLEDCPDPNLCENADLDLSGVVDYNDLGVIGDNWLLTSN